MLTENYKLEVAASSWEQSLQEEKEECMGRGRGARDPRQEEGWGRGPGRAHPRLDFLPSSHAPSYSANILGGGSILKA